MIGDDDASNSSLHSDGFSQVPGTIHVASTQNGNMIRQQLHGNNSQNALQNVNGLRNLNGVFGPLHGFVITLFANQDGTTFSGRHLLQGVHALVVDSISHHDQDDWHGRVHQSQRSMFQFSGLDSFRMHISQLLDLQGSLQASGKIVSTAHDQQGLFLEQFFGDVQNFFVLFEHLFDEFRKSFERLNDFTSAGSHAQTILGHDEGKQGQWEDLGSVGLGGGNANFRSGIDVDSAVGLTRNSGSDGIGDT